MICLECKDREASIQGKCRRCYHRIYSRLCTGKKKNDMRWDKTIETEREEKEMKISHTQVFMGDKGDCYL